MPERNGNGAVGKLKHNELINIINSLRTVFHPPTLLGPRIGEDAAFIDLGSCLLVAHVDPITEAKRGSGKLAVIVAANDIAVSGARPRWALALFLLPPSGNIEDYHELFEEVGEEASKLGIEIIGGHTERSPGLQKPIVALSMLGCACKECAVPTGGSRPGDLVIQIGSVGREGVAILADDFRDILLSAGVEKSVIDAAARYKETLSVVDVAVELAGRRLVSSMHDATEGGLLGALVEAALASNNRFKIYKNKIIIDDIVKNITSALGIDPLKLISSGTIIATAPPSNASRVIEIARASGYEADVIGVVEAPGNPGVLLVSPEGEHFIKEPPEDEISRFWA